MRKTAICIIVLFLCTLIPLAGAPQAAAAETDNLITNPDFEDVGTNGKPTGWRIPSSYTEMVSYDTAVFRGSGETGRSVHLTGPASTDTPYITCDVAVEELCTYEISMYVRVGKLGYRGIAFEMYFFDHATKDNYDASEELSLKNHRLEASEEWVQVKDTFTVPAGMVRARLMFRLKSGGEAWIDDTDCRKVSEPAYLTLTPEKVFNYTEDGTGRAVAELNTVSYPEIANSPVTFTIAGTDQTAVVTPTDGKAAFSYDVKALKTLKTAYTLTATVADHSYSTEVYRYNRPTAMDTPMEKPVYAYHTDTYLLAKYEEINQENLTAEFQELADSGINILQVSAGNFRQKLTAAKAAGVKLIVNLYNNMYPAGHEKNVATTTSFVKQVTQNTWGTGGTAIDFSDVIFAWAIMDEPFANDPGCYPDLLASYTLIRSLDDVHPIWVMDDGNNYELSAKACDILGIDIYPGSSPHYTYITEKFEQAVQESGGIVPIYPLYQTFLYKNWFPDGDALRSMIYQGFLHGGEAVGYYELDKAYAENGADVPLYDTALWQDVCDWYAEEADIAFRHFTGTETVLLKEEKGDEVWTRLWRDGENLYALFVSRSGTAETAAIADAGENLYVDKAYGGEAGVSGTSVTCTVPAGGAVLCSLKAAGDNLMLLKEGRWETEVSAGTWEVRGTLEKPLFVFAGLYKDGELTGFWPFGSKTGTFRESFVIPEADLQGATLRCFAWDSGLVPVTSADPVGTK